MPSAFRDDVEAYLARLAGSDPLDIDGPAHPARASTLKTRRFQFLQLASALAHKGYPVEQLRNLRDLTDIAAVRLALQYFIDRAQREKTSQVAGLAALLYSVAAHWCKRPEAELELLRRFRRNLQPTTHGLTAKNRERLRQFTDEHKIIALLGLPPRMFEAIHRKQTLDRTDLADLQVALALEILLMAPIRRANVVGLRIGPDGHIKPRQDRKGTTHIVIGAHEVKNHRPLEYPVPAETARLIELYLARVLPLISDHPGDWLFPGEQPGQHRSFDAFSNQFTRTIRRWTGLTVNPHLMRHIGAKLFLDRNPGAYEVVRHVLGHSQRSTALDHYTGLETEAALRHYDRVILGIREGIAREVAQ